MHRQGPLVLSLSGRLRQPNRGAAVAFDMAMLKRLPQALFSTRTPWYAHARRFSGPLLRDLLATCCRPPAAGSHATLLAAAALNGYRVDLPVGHAIRYDLLVAWLLDELRDARIEAEAASAAKSEFLADMSHELRTPLRGLLGMLSLVKDSPRDPQAADWIATADESAQHLLRLLDNIFDLSKLESGALTLTPSPVVLALLLRAVRALLQQAASAKGLALHATRQRQRRLRRWIWC